MTELGQSGMLTRIEDDILITDNAPKVLSSAAGPSKLEDLEQRWPGCVKIGGHRPN